MTNLIHRNITCFAAIIALSLLSNAATAQSADQAIRSIPQTTKQTAETKVVTKSNSVANSTMNTLDSASDKAFKGFIGLFKKKNHPKDSTSKGDLKGDSTRMRPIESVVTPPKSSSRVSIRPSRYYAMRRLGRNRPVRDLS